MKKTLFLFCILFTLCSCSSHVNFRSRDLNKALENDPKGRIGKLDNGLSYVIRRNKNPAGQAEFRLGINGGSLLENGEEHGAAHFIEHMAFNGSQHFSENKVIDFFRNHGMAFGADLNAFTGHTKTVYRFSLPTDQKEAIDTGFVVLQDWASGINFDEKEVNKERGIILEELRMKRSAAKRIRDKIMPLVYGPLYSENLPIGRENVIQSISAEELKTLYKKWYQPELMAVVVVGDIDVDEMESKIKASFSSLTNVKNLPRLKDFEIPKYEAIQSVNVTDPEQIDSLIRIYQHTKTRKMIIEKDLRQYLIGQLYTEILNNRFLDKKSTEQACHRVSCSQGWLTEHDGFFYTGAQVKDNNYRQCFKEIFLEIEMVGRYGVQEGELENAKNILLENSQAAVKKQHTKKSLHYANQYIKKALDKSIIFSADSYDRLNRKYLATIQAKEINDFHNQIQLQSNRIMISLGNDDTAKYFASHEKLKQILADVKSQHLEPYVYTAMEKPFFTKKVIQGKIVKQIYNENLDITILDLSNGARVILKPTQFEKNEITFWAHSQGGISLIAPELKPVSQLVNPMVQNSGIGPYTKQELVKKLKGKKLNLNLYLGIYEEGLKGSFSPDNLELFFQLLHLGISQPRFDHAVFQEQKTILAQNISHQQKTAFGKFFNRLSAELFEDNLYAQQITPEAVLKLGPDKCRDIFFQRFINGNDFIFQFVGDFKVADVIFYIEKYIASLPSNGTIEKARDIGLIPPTGKSYYKIDENLEDKSFILILLHDYFKFTEETTYELATLKTILDIKINEELREKNSLIYSGKSFCKFYPGMPVPYSEIYFHFMCAPENTKKVIAGLKKILNVLKEENLSAEKIQMIKKIVKTNSKKDRANNWWWSTVLHNLIIQDQDLNQLLEYADYIETFSPATLQGYAKKYLSQDNMVIGILNPKSGD